MANKLDFRLLRVKNAKRCEKNFHPIRSWNPLEWGACAAGEVGELCNLLKKHKKRSKKVNVEEIAFEIADAICYLDLLAAYYDIDLGVAVFKKFNVVSDRIGSNIKFNFNEKESLIYKDIECQTEFINKWYGNEKL